MREELLMPIFIRKALRGEPLTVAGKGDQFRKFLYVTDLARAHVLAMAPQAANQTYNIEGRRQITILEVAEGIKEILGDQVTIEFVPARPGDFPGKEINYEKARRELGWEPLVDFKEGLRRTVDWFRARWRL
jgi:UDP-glucose 4-epimerase